MLSICRDCTNFLGLSIGAFGSAHGICEKHTDIDCLTGVVTYPDCAAKNGGTTDCHEYIFKEQSTCPLNK